MCRYHLVLLSPLGNAQPRVPLLAFEIVCPCSAVSPASCWVVDSLDDRLHGRLLVGARCISLGGNVAAAAAAVGSGMAAAVAAGLEAECAAEVAGRTFGDRCWRTAVGAEGEGMSHDWGRTAVVVEADKTVGEQIRGK